MRPAAPSRSSLARASGTPGALEQHHALDQVGVDARLARRPLHVGPEARHARPRSPRSRPGSSRRPRGCGRPPRATRTRAWRPALVRPRVVLEVDRAVARRRRRPGARRTRGRRATRTASTTSAAARRRRCTGRIARPLRLSGHAGKPVADVDQRAVRLAGTRTSGGAPSGCSAARCAGPGPRAAACWSSAAPGCPCPRRTSADPPNGIRARRCGMPKYGFTSVWRPGRERRPADRRADRARLHLGRDVGHLVVAERLVHEHLVRRRARAAGRS